MMLYTINLVRRMKGLKSPGGYTVESVAIDTAEDLPEES